MMKSRRFTLRKKENSWTLIPESSGEQSHLFEKREHALFYYRNYISTSGSQLILILD